VFFRGVLAPLVGQDVIEGVVEAAHFARGALRLFCRDFGLRVVLLRNDAVPGLLDGVQGQVGTVAQVGEQQAGAV
jgi:hypothetical protein